MNVVSLRAKKYEKMYREFYKTGGVNLKLDIIYKNDLHNYKNSKKLHNTNLKLINGVS